MIFMLLIHATVIHAVAEKDAVNNVALHVMPIMIIVLQEGIIQMVISRLVTLALLAQGVNIRTTGVKAVARLALEDTTAHLLPPLTMVALQVTIAHLEVAVTNHALLDNTKVIPIQLDVTLALLDNIKAVLLKPRA